MAADVQDLRQHFESHAVAEQISQSVGQRLREAAERGKANLKAKQQELADSAKAPSPRSAARSPMEKRSSRVGRWSG
jgi:hypothetical protein